LLPQLDRLTRPQNEILEHRIGNGSVLQFGCSPRDALWRIILVNKRRKVYHSDLQITRAELFVIHRPEQDCGNLA
jgi:hypothetical protein